MFDVNLPKWPQMAVWGKQITVEQARQVIMATDKFLYAGWCSHNDHLQKWWQGATGLDALSDLGTDDWVWKTRCREAVQEKMGHIDLEYVRMEQISTSYIGGPNGFVDQHGNIFYAENVGKWPSCKEVLDDWQKIATAFPFLDLTVTLMSGEHTEHNIYPVASIRVQNGNAVGLEIPVYPGNEWLPASTIHHDSVEDRWMKSLLSGVKECAIPLRWLVEESGKVRAVVEEVIKSIPRN